jgi:hypothetical protein
MTVHEQMSEPVGGVLRGTVASVNTSGAYTFSKPARDEIRLVAGLGVEGDVHAGVHVRHRSRVRADPSQPNLRQVHLIHRELFEEVGEKGYGVAPGQLGENVTTDGLDLLGLPRGTVLRFGTAPAAADAGAAAGSGDAPSDGVDGLGGAGAVHGGGASPEAPVDVVAAVVAAARGAELDAPTAAAVAALVAAAERDSGLDPRPAVVVTGLRNPCAQIDRFQDGLLGQVAHRDANGVFVRKAGIMGVVLRGGPVCPGDAITVELPPRPHEPLDRI